MVTIANLIATGQSFGIFDFFLPFILMFAIFYGLLAKTKIFGNSNEKPARIVNLVISLGVAAYILIFTPAGTTISSFMANFFGQTMIAIFSLLAFIMVLYLVMNILKPGASWDWTKWAWAALIVTAILVGGAFISSGGGMVFPGLKLPYSFDFGMNSGLLALLIVIALTALVIYFLSKSDGDGGSDRTVIR
jgi:hypothetical protein